MQVYLAVYRSMQWEEKLAVQIKHTSSMNSVCVQTDVSVCFSFPIQFRYSSLIYFGFLSVWRCWMGVSVRPARVHPTKLQHKIITSCLMETHCSICVINTWGTKLQFQNAFLWKWMFVTWAAWPKVLNNRHSSALSWGQRQKTLPGKI